ncbi:MAG: ankyrin repeat domain-containing protein [Arcobacter sp.]|nr:ankyrin repeat domain-containing protein [Arcobacter sp.]
MSNIDILNKNELSELLIQNINNKLTFDQLILNGANVNYQNSTGWSIFFESIINGNLEILKRVLKFDIDVNQRDNNGRNAIFWAMFCENIDVLELLLSYKIKINLLIHKSEKLKALHYAVFKGRIDFVKVLLKYGSFIDEVDHFKATSLFYAVMYKKIDIVLYLLEKGANKYHKDIFGNSAYSLSLKLGFKSVLEN